MILTAEQQKEIAKGVEHWENGPEGGLIPHRFSVGQEKIYRSDEARFLRTRATSGVRLECRTDAVGLELSLRAFPGSARDWYGLDLVVDGCLFGHKEGTLQEAEHIHWVQNLPAGEKLITIYLPCLTGVEILEMKLQGATFIQNTERKEKILFMGDSITQGYISHFPSVTYPAQVAAHRNADFLNQGNGGEVFHPEILEPLNWHPTLAVIAYGTNDWSTKERERVIRDAGEFLDRFCKIWPGLPTAVLTPIWRADYLTRREDDFRHEEVQEILLGLAASHPQMKVISGYELFPMMAELMEDRRIHPNELGFVTYARNLCGALDTLYPQNEGDMLCV